MCDLAKILLGLGSTIGALGTFGVAFCAYKLAKKNFEIIADKHDREAVSIAFLNFRSKNFLIYPSFIIHNKASVPLIIEGIKLKKHNENMGWYAEVYGFHNGSYEKPLAIWTEKGLKKKFGLEGEVYGITGWSEQNLDDFKSIILNPSESAKISCEYLTSENMNENFNIGSLKARLCYNKAKTLSYDLNIPDTEESRKIIHGSQINHINSKPSV